MLMKNPISLGPDCRTSSKHQDMQPNNIFSTTTKENRCGLHSRTVRIQTARLVEPVNIIPHDAHGASGKFEKSLRHTFFYGIKHTTCYRTIITDFKYEMRDACIITKRTVISLCYFRVLQNSLQNPFCLFILFCFNCLLIGFFLVFTKSTPRCYQCIPYKCYYLIMASIHRCSSHALPR